MTVKEVKDRIASLQYDRENFVKIQNFCIGTTSSEGDEEHIKVCEALESGADLNTHLQFLVSRTIENIDEEIKRLERIIDLAIVQID